MADENDDIPELDAAASSEASSASAPTSCVCEAPCGAEAGPWASAQRRARHRPLLRWSRRTPRPCYVKSAPSEAFCSPLSLPPHTQQFCSSFLSTNVVQPLSSFVADSRSFVVGCEYPASGGATSSLPPFLRSLLLLSPLPPLHKGSLGRHAALLHTSLTCHDTLPLPHAEFNATLSNTAMGALLMGVIAFLVKIVHIPITQMLVSAPTS